MTFRRYESVYRTRRTNRRHFAKIYPVTLQVETFVVGPMTNNLYLLRDDVAREAVLIDPSIESDAALARMRALSEAGTRLTAIWNTHGHFDHIHDTARWREAYDVPILMHHDDEYWVQRLRDQALWMGFAPPTTAPPTQWLNGGETLMVGSHRARVLHTPGHSPGSVSYIFDDKGLCISGDVVFAGSVGRTDLPRCSPPQLQQSLARLMALPGATRILPGHYEPTTVRQELQHNPFCQQLPDPHDDPKLPDSEETP